MDASPNTHFWVAVGCGSDLYSLLFADRLVLYVAWVNEYDDSGDRKVFSFYVFHFPFVSLCLVAAVFSSSKFSVFFRKKSWAILASSLRKFGNAEFTNPRPTIQGGPITDLTGLSSYYYNCFL